MPMKRDSIGDIHDFARGIVSEKTGYGIGYLYRNGTALIEKAKQKKGVTRIVYNAAGFTLVELSIVLVIVGLLIGGILVAQSMVQAATVQSVVRQVGQFDAAIMNFQGKYRYLPGDSPHHDAAGDGDGKVETIGTNNGTQNNTGARFDLETANFWRHLQQDGFLRNEYSEFSADASSGIRAGVHIPKIKADRANTGIHMYWNTFWPATHWYRIAYYENSTSGNYGPSMAPAYKAATALAIDQKFNGNGIARLTDMSTFTGNVWAATTSPSCYDTSGSSPYHYDISDNEVRCAIHIRMGIQTGMD